MTFHSDTERLLQAASAVHHNISAAALIEHAVRRGEAQFTDSGAIVAMTGEHTGRSPKDRYIVRDSLTDGAVDWGGFNQPIDSDIFKAFSKSLIDAPVNDELFVQDLFVGADDKTRLKVRVISEQAWHNLFAQNVFIVPTAEERKDFVPDWLVIQRPGIEADYDALGVRSTTCIMLDFSHRMVCIAGTEYPGEIKKSIFGVMNFMLPAHNIMPMHCSANVGQDGSTALFFGLSGTGKTTLSADPNRPLIGDDEHGWGHENVFNFEGGCYAKVVNLDPDGEPGIWQASNRFGAVLENVILDETTRTPAFENTSITENTRSSYPVEYMDNALLEGIGPKPKNIIFLTADAYGVLPPLCKLTPAEAVFHFLSGYTAKVAGTEKGLGSEPQATFSACFGAPFMPRQPMEYAKLLRKKVETENVQCWLLNTGWTGGKPGVGKRFPLKATRQLLASTLNGTLDHAPTRKADIFGFTAVTDCAGVDASLMDPRASWADKDAYDRTANVLWQQFKDNFERFLDVADDDVRQLVLGD